MSAIGRVAALPRRAEPRLAIVWEDRLLLGTCAPEALRALSRHGVVVGDLVAFSWQPPEHFSALARLGGPQGGRAPEDADAWRWRRPGAAASRMSRLRLRHRVLRALRDWLDREGFIEVDTPVLVPAPSPEPQFAPFRVGGEYLITSPEFQLKRLLVGGFEKIYRLGPAFRSGEVGRLHNPEFTLLEWYRVGEGLEAMARDLESLLGATLPLAEARDAEGRLLVPPDPFHAGELGSVALDCRAPFPRRSVAALFREHLGMAIEDAGDAPAFREAARRAGLPGAEELAGDFEQAFFALWNRFEPRLGREAPLLVMDWPAPLASLARLKPGDPRVAERMEWIVAGIELANGFAELTDPEEQRQRFEQDRALRRARGLPEVPLDERFLGALEEGMPPAAGMALGVDRLVMLLAGARSLAEVLAFTWGER
jgi:lysyl-tRNA synthetase class 2